MPAIPTISRQTRHPRVATLRTLIWIEELRFQGWGCSECAWVFSSAPDGNALEEMGEGFERLRDKEFATHVCVEPPRARLTKARYSRRGNAGALGLQGMVTTAG